MIHKIDNLIFYWNCTKDVLLKDFVLKNIQDSWNKIKSCKKSRYKVNLRVWRQIYDLSTKTRIIIFLTWKNVKVFSLNVDNFFNDSFFFQFFFSFPKCFFYVFIYFIFIKNLSYFLHICHYHFSKKCSRFFFVTKGVKPEGNPLRVLMIYIS